MKKQPDKAAPSRIYKKKQPRERVHCLNLISENLTKKTLSRVRWKFLLHKKLNKELAANNGCFCRYRSTVYVIKLRIN